LAALRSELEASKAVVASLAATLAAAEAKKKEGD
jgi:hypothetical protein